MSQQEDRGSLMPQPQVKTWRLAIASSNAVVAVLARDEI